MDEKKPRTIKKIQLFAPYRQCETTLHATAMASFILRKLKDIRVYDLQYITADALTGYCSPFVDPHVRTVLSPNEYAAMFRDSEGVVKTTYWFDNHWDYLAKAASSYRRKNFMFGNFTKWNVEQMKKTRDYSSTIFPCKSVCERMQTLISCYDNRAIYPGSFRSISPMRCDLTDRKRMSVILSMCSINRPNNRLAILQNVENVVKNRSDIFITLLMDGHVFKDERQHIERLGLEYSDKCLIIDSFSDYEYMNILTQSDVFIDLNPINGIGYLLSAALNRGLLVGGFNQPLYRDILSNGEYGLLLTGTKKEYGYGFDHVVPNWDSVFKVLNGKVFVVDNILRWMEYRNDRPNFMTTLEARFKAFLGMFTYLTNAKVKAGSFVRV